MKNFLIISVGFNIIAAIMVVYFFTQKNDDSSGSWKNVELTFTQPIKNIVNSDELIENSYIIMYKEFLSVETLEDFSTFLEVYNLYNILPFTLKTRDKQSWDKYWVLFYELNKETIEEDYDTSFFDILYTQIVSWEPFEFQKEIDLTVFFSNSPLEVALNQCEILRSTDEYYSELSSCQDKIYLYRANSENNFCENIQDTFRKQLCVDSLK